jgi:hypothetical protein
MAEACARGRDHFTNQEAREQSKGMALSYGNSLWRELSGPMKVSLILPKGSNLNDTRSSYIKTLRTKFATHITLGYRLKPCLNHTAMEGGTMGNGSA